MRESLETSAHDSSEPAPRPGSSSRIERMSFGAGAAVIERMGENVIRLELSGRVGPELGDVVISAMAREIAKLDSFHLFLDLEQLDEYHSSLRTRAVEFLLRDPLRLLAAHGLGRAKMVNMALAVANLSLGGKVMIHEDRLHYEIALRDAVHGVGGPAEDAFI
jgi:hypothetical protein